MTALSAEMSHVPFEVSRNFQRGALKQQEGWTLEAGGVIRARRRYSKGP